MADNTSTKPKNKRVRQQHNNRISRKNFLVRYEELKAENEGEDIFPKILEQLEEAISESEEDVADLNQLTTFIDYLSDVEDELVLIEYYSNLVILASKYDKSKILGCLLTCNNVIIRNLAIKKQLSPYKEDDFCHNAFYYAIRSGNFEMLDVLINKWPVNYFTEYSDELDRILSHTYDDLKLKNVPLSEKMDIFVQMKIVNLRFFSDGQDIHNAKNNLPNIEARINIVLEKIAVLKAEFSSTKKVDAKFLYLIQFIAKNVHVLKYQLKFSYDRLPWEEIEFCMLCFVSGHTKQDEMNMFYNAILGKAKLLNYLGNFAMNLKETKSILKNKDISKFPESYREEVVDDIVRNCPEYEELYRDYNQIRDNYSLHKISEYINLAMSCDPKQREGQLIITRSLQVVGEHMKNTLESPKLSTATNGLLLMSLPKITIEVITKLRNSISHSKSLARRIEIEEKDDFEFFIGIQNDIKQIDNVIADILTSNKIKLIRRLLRKLIDCETLDGLQEITDVFKNAEIQNLSLFRSRNKIVRIVMTENRFTELENKLSNIVTDPSNFEVEAFKKIREKIQFVHSKAEVTKMDYTKAFLSLKYLGYQLADHDKNHLSVRFYEKDAIQLLENIAPKSHNFKEIAELAMKIIRSAKSRLRGESLLKLHRVKCEILYMAELETDDLNWLHELRDKLTEKGSTVPSPNQNKGCRALDDKCNDLLEQRLLELNNVLKNYELGSRLIGKFEAYKKNKKLQAVVEMLVLDIMSMFCRSKKYLQNNLLFLDDSTPLLTGKCLRNHLAHENAVVDFLLSDPSIAVVLNAEMLTTEEITTSNRKLGKFVKDEPDKLKSKCDQNLMAIENQNKMFSSLEEGNWEEFQECLRNGADIFAKCINSSSSALHYAARSSNLEMVQWILDKKLNIYDKNVHGENPVHIAVAHGQRDIVQYFLSECGINVDEVDKNDRTALHVAAKKGHLDIVEILLKNNADPNARSAGGYTALHCAVNFNHINVAKILLKEVDFNCNEIEQGFAALHLASQYGYNEFVDFLHQNGADINLRNDRGQSPLHLASQAGHLDTVIALIQYGADVNCRAVNGCTPLLCALEYGEEKVADVLLKNGVIPILLTRNSLIRLYTIMQRWIYRNS